MTSTKLTGLHTKLFPRLIDSGFLVFDNEKIKLLKSLINTGTLTKPGTMEPTKKDCNYSLTTYSIADVEK